MNETEGPIKASATSEDKELLRKARKHYAIDVRADREQRREGLEDIKFACQPGSQWEDNQKKERGKRPCYEFNKIRVTGKRIINNMRAQRPSGKVIGAEDNDKETAEIMEGLVRSIWAGGGDAVVDYAAEYQVFGGYGAWRIVTDYSQGDTFDQDIELEPIMNPFCLYSDAAARDVLKRDATRWIYTEKITNEEFEEKYGDADQVSFQDSEFDDDQEWNDEKYTRIAEYWYQKPVERELCQLETGEVVEVGGDDYNAAMKAGIPIKKRQDGKEVRRTVETKEIWMCVVSGNAVLEQPTKWAGSFFPFVPLYGEYYIIDGKICWNGITRFAKDAQRSYNIARTSVTETIALAPQAKFWSTPKQADGHEPYWKTAHQKNYPFMLYNPDPEAPGTPQRMGGADIPVALIQESQIASEEINMVTGIYQSDYGAPNQATSGRQEIARQNAGAMATFNYQDNTSNAVEHTWRLLIDLIPKVYDTERSMRILGADESEKYVRVNQVINGETINDLAKGKYDVIVKTGPNFSTQRQEAAETYQSMLQGNPQIFPMIGDLIFRAMDLPYSEDIAERLKVMLPPEIQQLVNDEVEVPPEVQAMMQQAQQAMQMVEQRMQEVQEAANEAEIEKSEVEKLMANLEKKQAQFEAKVAKEMAKLEKVELGMVKKNIMNQSDGVIEASKQEAQAANMAFSEIMAQEMAQGMQAIQNQAEQFLMAAGEAVSEIKDEKEKRPKVVRVESKRENGKLVAVPIYEDGE